GDVRWLSLARRIGTVDVVFFFSSRRRHTRFSRDWSSDVCSSDLLGVYQLGEEEEAARYGVKPGDFKIEDVNNDGRYTDEDRQFRSEERRVGKEWRARWSPDHEKNKEKN